MSASFDPYCEWLGIPPSEQPPDHYRLLGTERFEDDANVIAAAADRQIAFVIGLQKGDRASMAQRLVNELSAARACLVNPATRAEYDAALKSRLPTGALSGQHVARPAPRSTVEPPVGSRPPAGTPLPSPSGAPYPAPTPLSAPQQNAAWPPGTFPAAGAAHGQSPGIAGPPAGSMAGPTPAYAAPPPAGPPVSTPAGIASPEGPPPPPIGEPPVSPPASAPIISVGDPVAMATRSSEPSADDDADSTQNQQLWLLAAIVGVVILGTGLTLAVFTLGRAPKDAVQDDGGETTTEVVSGPLVEQLADASLHLTAADAVIHGDTPARGFTTGRRVITNWTSSHDWLSWDCQVDQPRMFRVELIYAAPAGYGGKFSVAIDGMQKEAAVRNTTGADVFSPHEVGFLTVRRSGRYRFEMHATQNPAGQLMILRAIHLTPYDIGHVR